MMRFRFLFAVLLFITTFGAGQAKADAQDQWWNEGWPYRVPVSVSGSGTVAVSIDFTEAFEQMGLKGGLLDIRSIRVVSYSGNSPGDLVAFDETYTTILDDGDNPQIGNSSGSGVYWSVNDGQASADTSRYSQGTGSVKALVENRPDGYGYPGVELRISDGSTLSDWRNFEVFVYDVWPEVNESAKDQAPDLYSFKLYNTNGCESSNMTQGGPPLALDRWNRASVSLKPFHTCTTPDFNDITRMEFHTRDNETVQGNSGLYDNGDQLTLWFDNVRLVDQDGGGLIKWNADGSAQHYYIYFDTIDHEGHPAPELTSLGNATTNGTVGTVEAGGYFHRISGASETGMQIWAAPPIEKILKSQQIPVASSALQIKAAKDEFEPFQIVVRVNESGAAAVNIGDFVSEAGTIASSNVTLHRVDYISLTQLSDDFGRLGDWPDPLYPLQMGELVSFESGVNQPLWFTVHVPRNAAAGVYSATVSIGQSTIPVELEVWDFELPREIHLAGEWGFGWSRVVERYLGTIDGNVQDCYWDLVDALYEDFADHRLTPKGTAWPTGLNYPGGVEYDCNGNLDPDSWGIWGFASQAQKYLNGGEMDNQTGFRVFHLNGPANNYPPESRPSSFCDESRGNDPPGNTNYNKKWFQYWEAVSNYLGEHPDIAQKAYYHIVNEPQTFDDYDIVAFLAQYTKSAAPNVRILISEQVEESIYNNSKYPGSKVDIWMPTISTYEVERSWHRQLNYDEEVWWYFLYGDRPPLPNPTVIDRTGLEARITPWLAWLERVDGLVYYSITRWDPNPWDQSWLADGNGDAFMIYPPKDDTVAFDACDPQSNRLVPSLRWELLREGMEDYEYLWLMTGGDPQISVNHQADELAREFISSRTAFSRVPSDIYKTRAKIAGYLSDPNFDPDYDPNAQPEADPDPALNGENWSPNEDSCDCSAVGFNQSLSLMQIVWTMF